MAGSKPLYLDLFAGAGGLSLGLTAAGFQCVGAIERDARAAETYALNFPDHAAQPLSGLGPTHGDIRNLTRLKVEAGLRELGHPELALVAGGPPCQGFSRVGRGKLNSLARRAGAFREDPRNNLYRRFLDIIQWTRPRAFLFENVVGMLHVRGLNAVELVCENARELGYRVRCAILNAAWYGVPQYRERVFVLGIREDLGRDPVFPAPLARGASGRGYLSGESLNSSAFENPDYLVRVTPGRDLPSPITVKQALGDLPALIPPPPGASRTVARLLPEPTAYPVGRPSAYAALMRNWDPRYPSTAVHDHACRHTPRDYRIFARMKPGDCYPVAVQIAERLYRDARRKHGSSVRRRHFIPPYSLEGFEEKWRVLDPRQPACTVTAHLSKDCYSHIHYDPVQARTISIREAARLQSFPDDFRFSGGMGDRFRQVGNAVPPMLAFFVGHEIGTVPSRVAVSPASADPSVRTA